MNTVPLSKWRGLPHEYPRSYPHAPGRDERIAGDQRLLIALAKECQRLDSTAGELPDDLLRRIVEEVETLEFGSWKLDGEDSEPLRDRLDAWFLPLHEAWAAERDQQDTDLARRVSENAQFDREAAVRNAERDRAVWGLPA